MKTKKTAVLPSLPNFFLGFSAAILVASIAYSMGGQHLQGSVSTPMSNMGSFNKPTVGAFNKPQDQVRKTSENPGTHPSYLGPPTRPNETVQEANDRIATCGKTSEKINQCRLAVQRRLNEMSPTWEQTLLLIEWNISLNGNLTQNFAGLMQACTNKGMAIMKANFCR